MLINKDTSIAYLIKQDPKALEAIVSLSPGFSKLRNPFIRKLMANRTSIAMAAEIGGCSIEAFYDKLEKLGFLVENKSTDVTNNNDLENEGTINLQTDNQDIVEMDVRPLLELGTDPLSAIMKRLSEIKPGQALAIINTFIPTPLISLLGKKGYVHDTKKIGDDHYITTFYYQKLDTSSESPEIKGESRVTDFMNKLSEYKTRYKELDLRQMEMPLPLTTILETLMYFPKDHALYVHHKRFPIYLVPELTERGYDMQYIHQEDGVDLLIYQNEK